jgi:hypothetical protein
MPWTYSGNLSGQIKAKYRIVLTTLNPFQFA